MGGDLNDEPVTRSEHNRKFSVYGIIKYLENGKNFVKDCREDIFHDVLKGRINEKNNINKQRATMGNPANSFTGNKAMPRILDHVFHRSNTKFTSTWTKSFNSIERFYTVVPERYPKNTNVTLSDHTPVSSTIHVEKWFSLKWFKASSHYGGPSEDC